MAMSRDALYSDEIPSPSGMWTNKEDTLPTNHHDAIIHWLPCSEGYEHRSTHIQRPSNDDLHLRQVNSASIIITYNTVVIGQGYSEGDGNAEASADRAAYRAIQQLSQPLKDKLPTELHQRMQKQGEPPQYLHNPHELFLRMKSDFGHGEPFCTLTTHPSCSKLYRAKLDFQELKYNWHMGVASSHNMAYTERGAPRSEYQTAYPRRTYCSTENAAKKVALTDYIFTHYANWKSIGTQIGKLPRLEYHDKDTTKRMSNIEDTTAELAQALGAFRPSRSIRPGNSSVLPEDDWHRYLGIATIMENNQLKYITLAFHDGVEHTAQFIIPAELTATIRETIADEMLIKCFFDSMNPGIKWLQQAWHTHINPKIDLRWQEDHLPIHSTMITMVANVLGQRYEPEEELIQQLINRPTHTPWTRSERLQIVMEAMTCVETAAAMADARHHHFTLPVMKTPDTSEEDDQ